MMNLYIISGLGADKRVFRNLVFPENTNVIFLDWLVPLPDEPMDNYARRLSEKIDRSVPFIVAGLSFGGMLAVEMTAFMQPEKVILLSSVARRSELPFYYRLAGSLRLNKLMPGKAFNRSNAFMYWMFCLTEASDKALIDEMLQGTNSAFSKWAVNEILNWKRTTVPENIVRVHGSRDRVLPRTGFSPDHLVKNGGHFMVVNKSGEVSGIIKNIIRTLGNH